MKIAIDIRLARGLTGMGKYLSEVLIRLNKYPQFEYFHLDYQLPRRNLLEKIYDAIYEQFWMQLLVPQILIKQKAELLYSPNPPTCFFTNRPIILTIPDLLFYHDTGMKRFVKYYLLWVYRFSAWKATKIITFSENSKQNIIKILGADAKKIVVIPPCIREDIFGKKLANNKVKPVLEKFNIDRKFILNIPGTFVVRKKAEDLLACFQDLPKEIQQQFKLVFIGNDKHPSYQGFIKKIQDYNLEKSVVVTGYISEDELRAFYQEAYLLVNTAIYEGFALPPLEAMREGLPVIALTSGESSLSEVLGDAGIIVKTNQDLTQALLRVIQDPKLHAQMVKKGLTQAKKYNWDKAVQRIVNLIENTV